MLTEAVVDQIKQQIRHALVWTFLSCLKAKLKSLCCSLARLNTSLLNNSLTFSVKVSHCLALLHSSSTFYTPWLRFIKIETEEYIVAISDMVL